MSAAVDAIVASLTAEPGWASNPAEYVARYVGRAADIVDPSVRIGGPNATLADAARWTHVACALVVAAANPCVARGAVLDDLVTRFGDGGYP